ncbi:MAG: molybdenum cofactor cytidylyltransferase [Ktedonobacteraceae bacterium]
MSTTTAAILLAAGRSSRMGQGLHKLLLPLGGRSVLAHVVETVLASQAQPLVVVLGYQAEQVRTLLTPYTSKLNTSKLTVIENPDYQQGMSTSLRKGVETLMSSYPAVNGALIVLGDQPLMTPHILDSMIETKQTAGKRITVARYRGKRGNPTLFDASLFPELLEMTGDEGGRKVLERHRQEIAILDMEDETPNYDVDTCEAYQQVVRIWEGHT